MALSVTLNTLFTTAAAPLKQAKPAADNDQGQSKFPEDSGRSGSGTPIIAPPLGRQVIVRQAPVRPAELSFFSEKATDYYLRCDQISFFKKYEQTQYDLEDTAPGTPQHQNLELALRDLRAIALARGISLTGYDTLNFRGLTPAENRLIAGIDSAAELVRNVELFARKYLAADGQQKRDYASVFYHFDELAVKFGLRSLDLDKIFAGVCKEMKCGLDSHGRITDMAKLARLSSSAEVGPEGLPREVKAILVKTKYWNLIKGNLHTIVFTTDINSGHSRGRAYPFLHRVEIDFNGVDGKVLSPWQIAGILVHEAAHVSWRAEAPVLQNTTPGERQAYATELAFYGAYAGKFGPPADLHNFAVICRASEWAVKTANQILGYAPDDLSPNKTVLPDPKIDLSYYPAKPNPAFLAVRSDFARLAANGPEADRASADLLWGILEGRAELDISLPHGYQKDAPIPLPEVILADQTGRTVLTEQQVKRLDKLCQLLLPPSPGSPASGPYETLLLFGSQGKAEAAQTDYQITAVRIRSKLYKAELFK